MPSQSEKAQTMRDLHQGSETFLIPGPWDVASARVFGSLGFQALATTSGGLAYSLGKLDGEVTLEEKVVHCSALAEATQIPITADLENGYFHHPEGVAETIRRISETGVVGGSIEDWSGEGIYDFNHSVERIEAAVEAGGRSIFRLLSSVVARIYCANKIIWMTPFGGYRLMKRQVLMSCLPLDCARWKKLKLWLMRLVHP